MPVTDSPGHEVSNLGNVRGPGPSPYVDSLGYVQHNARRQNPKRAPPRVRGVRRSLSSRYGNVPLQRRRYRQPGNGRLVAVRMSTRQLDLVCPLAKLHNRTLVGELTTAVEVNLEAQAENLRRAKRGQERR